ncbi:hypothetical protein LPJ72_002783 [Coemansia sp. Benny D160-2]|nr:hypothetical protein LPJ72_002783 [Coemansia sp. Benny D160-2]
MRLTAATAVVVVAIAGCCGSMLLVSAAQADAAAAGGGIEDGWEYVTSGSTLKLSHTKSNTRLTMPQVGYGTGSQQQAVTTQSDASQTKALWAIELAPDSESASEPEAARGSRIPCGSRIRLVNSDTSHSLHSHGNHKSPMSGNQEVSGYEGRDAGDFWTVECAAKGAAEFWLREAPVYFKHVDTGKYLQSLPNKKYRQPISGHQEVSAGKKADANAQWMALEGFYFR